MYFSVNLLVILAIVASATCKDNQSSLLEYLQQAKGHATESSTHVFNYVVAILKKSKFLSAGVLINQHWVMTGADALYS